MLQLPPFLLKVVEKLKSIKKKTSGGILGAMTGSMTDDSTAGTVGGAGTTSATTENRLDKFEKSMIKLQDLLHNPKECEFNVVTIPTELATAESERFVYYYITFIIIAIIIFYLIIINFIIYNTILHYTWY